jgi:LruC domain-containing protein
MKKRTSIKKFFGAFVLMMALMSFSLSSQAVVCEITKTNGGGFTTTIQSVIDNCDGTYTIILRVEHDGCPGPTCKELSHYSVEADPGTYSNISVAIISGGMTYGNIDMGPNLGSDPFDGFKIDDTEGIGDGMAGEFTITYTLVGLQDQQTSAKAGQNRQIVNFTVEDFEWVMNCAGTNCGGEPDTDGDGCDDTVDEYPTDPTRCYDTYYPANGNGSLAFEDLWPGQGDYDFNDLVIDYRFKTTYSAENTVVDMDGTFIILAFGATLHNGFGFQFGNNTFDQTELTATGSELSEGYITLDANGLEANQSIPTVIVYDDAYNQMAYPGTGIGVNTEVGAPYVTPDTLLIEVSFPLDTYDADDLDIENFNPFLIKNMQRGIEIHLPDYPPTDLVDASYFGTAHDDSNPAIGRYYKTVGNLPWAINIYEQFDYPIELQDITWAYLHFVQWANSSGTLYPDWYQDKTGYRDATKIYPIP